MSIKTGNTSAKEQAVAQNDDVVLEVEDLAVQYVLKKSVVEAVNGLSFKLKKRKAIGIVGETGAGKTTTALAIMNLVPDPPGIIKRGKINVCDMICWVLSRIS
jgi:peptide/nickel transport system ATP-binding protein